MEKIDLKRKHKISNRDMYEKIKALQYTLSKWIKNNDCSFYIKDRCEITPTSKSEILNRDSLVGYFKIERITKDGYWYNEKTVKKADINYGTYGFTQSGMIENMSLQLKKKVNRIFYKTYKGDLDFYKVRRLVRFFSTYFGWYVTRYEKPDPDLDIKLSNGYFKSYAYDCRVLDIINKNCRESTDYNSLLEPKVFEKESIDWIYNKFGNYA